MAKRKKPTRAEEIEALVKIQRRGPAFGAGLAVNPGFRAPNEVDRERGVDPDDPEREQAERAVAARALRELWPSNLRMWIFGAQRQFGGNARLVDELIAMKPIPPGRTRERHRADLLRAIQRSGPAKKPGRIQKHGGMAPDTATRDYRERIVLLILRTSQVVLAVFGLWAIVVEGREPDRHYGMFYTDPSDPEELTEAREILAAGGVKPGQLSGKGEYGAYDMVGYVWKVNDDKTVGSGVLVLEMLHGIQVQIDPRR